MFGLSMGIYKKSLSECENHIPVLRQERKAIIDEINRLYDNYEENIKRKLIVRKLRIFYLQF